MKAIYGFDPSKWKLGTLCIHGHAWPGTQQSLRRIGITPTCAGCGTTSQHWLAGFIVGVEGGDLPSGTKLSKPCKRGHTYLDTDWCLRKGGHCVECDKTRRQREALKLDIVERRQARSLAWARRNAQHINSRRRERLAACDELRQRKNQRRRVWRQANPEKEARSSRARQHRRRARLALANGFMSVSSRDIQLRFDEFNSRCAYCGADCSPTLDHFIPIASGGRHVLSNLLPACATCNLSKSARNPETWYRAQPFFTEQRWRMILTVLGKRRVPVGQLALV